MADPIEFNKTRVANYPELTSVLDATVGVAFLGAGEGEERRSTVDLSRLGQATTAAPPVSDYVPSNEAAPQAPAFAIQAAPADNSDGIPDRTEFFTFTVSYVQHVSSGPSVTAAIGALQTPDTHTSEFIGAASATTVADGDLSAPPLNLIRATAYEVGTVTDNAAVSLVDVSGATIGTAATSLRLPSGDSAASMYDAYTPTGVIAKAMFNFDEYGISNFKLSGPVRVSVSDDFSAADYLISHFSSELYTSGSNEIVWTAQMTANIQEVLAIYSQFANITFEWKGDYDSFVGSDLTPNPQDVGRANLSDININWIYRPDAGFGGISGINSDANFGYTGGAGDIFLNQYYYGGDYTLDLNTRARQTFEHEIGHSLGLAHPHNAYNNSTGVPTITADYAATRNLGFDQLGFRISSAADMYKEYFTIMAYDDQPSVLPGSVGLFNTHTPMILDLIALHEAYGEGAGTTGSGNDTITAGTAGYRAYFDKGGMDTIDLSMYTDGAHLQMGVNIIGAPHLVGLAMSKHDAQSIANGGDPANLRWFYGEYENANGGTNNDRLIGNAFDNIISGLAGNDYIDGGAGNDTLSGQAGDDLLLGRDGTDIIHSGLGFDRIDGGAGVDTLDFAGAGARVATMLTISRAWDSATDALLADVLNVENVSGSAFGDYLAGDGSANVLSGENGDDTLLGGASNDTLNGGAGDDTLNGEAGEDLLLGSDGTDIIHSGSGFDSIDGGAGVDTLDFAGAGARVATMLTISRAWDSATDALLADVLNVENVSGSAFGDYLAGDGSANVLSGANGDDTLLGGAANDTLNGGAGNDTLNGEAGDDLLLGSDGTDILHSGLGFDTIDGGAGVDTLDFAGAVARVATMLTISRSWDAATDVWLATTSNVENVSGSGFADYLAGDGSANVLSGENGDDTLLGGAANDTLNGGAGNDTLNGEAGNDVLLGGDGTDILFSGSGWDGIDGGAGIDTLDFSGAGGGIATVLTLSRVWDIQTDATLATMWGVENVTGSTSRDYIAGDGNSNGIAGGAGNDALLGDAGDDVLKGGDGADTLTGGSGSDRFDYDAIGDGADLITDFTSGAGGDKLDIKDVLVGYNPGASNLADFVQLSESGGHTTVAANASGGGANYAPLALLQGASGLVLQDLLAQGNLVVS